MKFNCLFILYALVTFTFSLCAKNLAKNLQVKNPATASTTVSTPTQTSAPVAVASKPAEAKSTSSAVSTTTVSTHTTTTVKKPESEKKHNLKKKDADDDKFDCKDLANLLKEIDQITSDVKKIKKNFYGRVQQFSTKDPTDGPMLKELKRSLKLIVKQDLLRIKEVMEFIHELKKELKSEHNSNCSKDKEKSAKKKLKKLEKKLQSFVEVIKSELKTL
jgi:hypothetical protein